MGIGSLVQGNRVTGSWESGHWFRGIRPLVNGSESLHTCLYVESDEDKEECNSLCCGGM